MSHHTSLDELTYKQLAEAKVEMSTLRAELAAANDKCGDLYDTVALLEQRVAQSAAWGEGMREALTWALPLLRRHFESIPAAPDSTAWKFAKNRLETYETTLATQAQAAQPKEGK